MGITPFRSDILKLLAEGYLSQLLVKKYGLVYKVPVEGTGPPKDLVIKELDRIGFCVV